MQCLECQFENPEDSNFCLECGQKLERKCPQCEKALPVGAKFCNGCGYKLKAKSTPSQKKFSFDEKLDKIQRYLPKGLTEKILAQKDRIEGERKQVTVMFCDMEGFTALSEKLGIEEAYSIMDQIYEILIHKVHDYEGTVNEMTGDGIMALFGAPIALEDASQRAIRSAMAIHREMTRFSDKKKQDQVNIPPIKMRIGIHTGPVVVGTLGNDLRVEFKAVANEDVTFLEGKCLSYSRGVAYHPVIDILKSNFDIREGDRDSEIREKVSRGLKVLDTDKAVILPYLLELLSVTDSGIDKIPISPEARKDRIIEAVRRMALRGSETRPLIMAFEDLHWIDKSSEEFMKDLLENISGARIFLIFTYRPEFAPTWSGKSYHNQVTLNRLSNRESLAMVAYLFRTEDIDNSLEELVWRRRKESHFSLRSL